MSDLMLNPSFPSLEDFVLPLDPAHTPTITGNTAEQPSPKLQSPHEPLPVEYTLPGETGWMMPDMFDGDTYGYGYQTNAKLHHTPSLTSLSSLNSYPGLNLYNHTSRQSSISSIAGLDEISPQHGQHQNGYTIAPKLHVQTQNLGRMGRMRSMSRVNPYDRRQRSESIGGKSEDDLSSAGSYHTPFTTQPLNRVTLQHRRSASNVTSPKPMLSRKYRSVSLLQPTNDFRLRSADETVRHLLYTAAEEMRSMPSASQQDKAKTAWIKKWLQLSYIVSPSHTVPRQGLYASYAASTEEYGVRAINSATFGKAVRNAFPGIETRRLGVRGNSKYHYIALRPAITAEAERLNRFGDSSGQWHVVAGNMTFQADLTDEAEMEELEDSEEEDSEEHIFAFDKPRPGFVRRHTTSDFTPPTPVYDFPGFPVLGNTDLGLTPLHTAQEFWNAFCRHQELLVSSIRNQHFDRFETNLNEFWGLLTPAWMQVCQHPLISQMISQAMSVTCVHVIGLLKSQTMSTAAQQSLRRLSSRLETCVDNCLSVYSREFAETKVELSVRVAHLLLRCADMHQLSCAILPILSDQHQLSDILAAWDRLNLTSLTDQCALSCNCNQATVEGILEGFRGWLGRSPNVVMLGQWLDRVVEECQGPGLLTRAGFVSSQVMRDFTLKSEPTFGLFQLIKTWIDDYISLSTLRHSILSTQSSSPINPNPVSSMSVMIPPAPSNPLDLADLNTAVPFDKDLGFGNLSMSNDQIFM